MDNRVILVVEDDEAIRDLIADVLGAEGYPVEAVANGREALRVVERTIPSLILLDLNMPVFNGFALVGELVARGISVPTILVSGATNLAEYATEMGAVAFVAKPLNIPHLLGTIERTHRRA